MFSEFLGNDAAVERVRSLVAAGRVARTLVLSGPQGVGKTTLAAMIGLALNCQQPPAAGDFCGVCESCQDFCGFDSMGAAIQQAEDFRGQEVKTRPRETAPLVVSLHPQIRLYPPDGDFLTMHQARELIHATQLQPDAGRTWVLIIPDFDKARWMVQTALLKTLEEPPERVALIAVVRNPLELLPTVRSRSLIIGLRPVSTATIEEMLAQRRPELSAPERKLIARLSQGCPGGARTFDLSDYRELREQALVMVESAARSGAKTHELLFRVTEGWRSGKEKFESLIEILYSVLQDILYLLAGNPDAIRNLDSRAELAALARGFSLDKLAQAVQELDRILSASRRNANRPLALDAWALRLAELPAAGT